MAEIFSDLASEILNQSFETKLISAVKLYKSLYCANDPNHFNVSKNKEIWLKVAGICNKTECMIRWYSLMREYFSSPPYTTWTHIEAFRNLGPNLSNNVQNPTKIQKDELLKELLLHSAILLSPESTRKTRLQIWMEIIAKCNKIPGAIWPITKWQEYWFSLKQNVAASWSKIRFKLYKTGDAIKIINVCGASHNNTLAIIASALMSNIELGDNWENPTAKCKNCLEQRHELLFNGYCLKCRHMKAALCCKCYNEIAVHKYQVNDWSQEAICLLQFEVTSKQILLCSSCAKKINKTATINWKSCRICEKPQTRYDYLYHNCNQNLRDVLQEATSFSFSECDGLPGYICEACKTQIKEFTKFYMQFKQTQIRLKYLHDIHFINDQFRKDKPTQLNENSNIETLLPDTKLESDIAAKNPTVTKPTPVIIQQNSATATRPFKCTLIGKAETIIEMLPDGINYDFFVQPNIQRQRRKPSLSDNAKATLQLANVDQVFSNNNITINKRILATQTTSGASTPLKSILNNKAISMVKGPSDFQPENEQMTTNTGKILKRLNIAPHAVLKNHKANEKFSVQPKTGSPQECIILPTSSGTKTRNSALSSKPFFTSSDYETIGDAPPVFCIPKNDPFNGEKPKTNFTSNQMKAYPKSLATLMPQNGVVDKHLLGNTPVAGSLTIRRVETLQKSQATTIIDLKKIPQTSKGTLATLKEIKKESEETIFMSPKQVTMSPQQILQKPQAKVAITLEQARMILHQQQEIKKARQYWDNVNEYQVDLLATETLPPNDMQCFTSTEQSIDITPVQSPSKVLIKEEILDKNYNDDILMEKTLVSSGSTTIYPDLFQLKSEPAEADDSFLTFPDIIAEQNSIIDDNIFDTNINASIPAFFEEEKESKEQSKLKRKKEDVKVEEEEGKEDGAENKKRRIQRPVKLKKLHIKLKRNKKIQTLLSQQLENHASYIRRKK